MEFDVQITEAFLMRSHFRRLFRNWKRLTIAFGLIVVGLGIGFSSGGLGRLSVLGMTVMAFCVLLYSAAWIRQRRSIREWIKKQGVTPVRYTLSEDVLTAQSVMGSTTLKWNVFERLVVQALDTLLELPGSGALTLPTSQIPQDAMIRLVEKFTAHGKPIKDSRPRGEQSPPAYPEGRADAPSGSAEACRWPKR